MDNELVIVKDKDEFLGVANEYGWENYSIPPQNRFPQCIRFDNGQPVSFSALEWYQKHSVFLNRTFISFNEWNKLLKKGEDNKNMNFVINVKTQAQYNAVTKYYNNKIVNSVWTSDQTCLRVSNGIINTYDSLSYYQKNNIPVVDFDSWAIIFNVELQPNKTMTLTTTYDAVVDYKNRVVKVGCQTIPFDKVEELVALIKE